jgi:hypothetical protein
MFICSFFQFSCQREFPGLVHFALIDRSRGRICTPILFSDEYKHYLTTNIDSNELEQIKEKKVRLNF